MHLFFVRFGKIFEPLPIWIHPASKIVTDFSVDKETLVKLGYKNVSQCSLSQAQGQRPESTNQQMMEYLKKVVPKMFQNTLSNLTTPVIQQFLDELTFRELHGQYPLACFDNLIQRISSQTASTAAKEDTMSAKLGRVATNPFLDWRYSEKNKDLTPKSKQTTPVRRTTPSPSPSRFGIDSLPPSLRAVESPVPSPSPTPGTVTPTGTKRAASVDPKADDIEESVNKRIKMAKELVSLESYYYCNLQGEDSVLSSEFKADMAFKCHVCKKLFMNNLEFMKHLHLHVETDRETAIDMADLTQCKFCYKDFDSEHKAQAHTDEQHFKKGSPCVCLICNSGFPQSTHLIHHMTKVHVKAEMPYQCQICAHRASQYRDIIEHFQETHDRTDKLQCPLCLKTYSLYGDKGYNSSNAVSFMQHLQKHEDIKTRNQLNCRKCCLKFIDEKSLKTHLMDDHVSFKDFENIETYQYVATDSPVQMPRPDEKLLKVAMKKSLTVKPLQQQAAFAAQNLEDMAIYGVIGDRCCECDRTMTMAGHYVAYLCCTKCRYSSCCAKAMSVHVQLFHAGAKPQFDLGKSVIMQEPMFCVCGYSAHSGNKLAKHLGSNGCRSAYPNLEEANKAKVEVAGGHETPDKDNEFSSIDQELEKGLDPRISITEAHKSSEKAAQKEGSTSVTGGDASEETAGPLAFLGLQRKGSREDAEEKKDEKEEEKEEAKDGESNEVFDKENEVNKESKEEGDDKIGEHNGENNEDDKESDKKDDEEMEVDNSKQDAVEESVAPKEPGMVLFGTLFKYMGEKKDEQDGASDPNESSKEEEMTTDLSNESKDPSPVKSDGAIEGKEVEEKQSDEESKEGSSVEEGSKEENSVEKESKDESSVEKESKEESSVEEESKEESSVEGESKEESSVEGESKEESSVEENMTNEDQPGEVSKDNASVEEKTAVESDEAKEDDKKSDAEVQMETE